MENSLLHQQQTNMVTIVPATAADAVLLSEVGGRSLIESHGNSAPAAVMQAYRERSFSVAALEIELADRSNVFHLILHKGQPAGYSKIIYHQPLAQVPQQRITKLERLYLLSEYYSLKLGHQLLQFNISLSKAQGEEGMWLYVWKGNERAIRFYERVGFRTIGEGQFRLTESHANEAWKMLLTY
ncbi:MAG: GNAT family N-acetyltransferase [Bacteroidota bacterium]|nr:GNAT family N-acetyltransferase [Bacteroidota bacterium]